LIENLDRGVLSIKALEDLERRSPSDNIVLEKCFNTLGIPNPQPVSNTSAESGSDDKVLSAQALPVTPGNPLPANNSLGLDIEYGF